MKELLNNALAFLGKKLDTLTLAVKETPKISIDLGDSTKSFEAAAAKMEVLLELGEKLDTVAFLIQESHSQAGTSLDRTLSNIHLATSHLADVADAFTRAETGRDLSVLDRSLSDISNQLERQTAALIKQIASGDTTKLLKSIHAAVKDIRLEERHIDLSELKTLTKAVGSLEKTLKAKDTANVEALLSQLIKSFKEFKVTIPKEIKIEEQQFRLLGAARFGGGGGSQHATNVTMANVTMTTANEESSYTFPANTVSFYMKLRSQNAKFTYAWVTGKLPTSGDGLAYATTAQNFLHSRPNIEFSGKTIYFQSDVASQVMEIESHQL